MLTVFTVSPPWGLQNPRRIILSPAASSFRKPFTVSAVRISSLQASKKRDQHWEQIRLMFMSSHQGSTLGL
jgi:hypothetical protein